MNLSKRWIFVGALPFLLLMGGSVPTAQAYGRSCSVAAYDFSWRGQFAGFIVKGRFSYDANATPANGIVREEDLLALDLSFYDPQGNLLRTYKDNHEYPVDDNGDPYANFAFDALTEQLLQDGTWKVDDDESRFRNGFIMGEGNPDLRSERGVQSGLAFWSRPGDDKVPHLHVDDWDDDNGDGEFGFPIGFSSHEDAGFLTKTTQDRIDTGKVGESYYQEDGDGNVVLNKLESDVGALGERVRVVRAKPDRLLWRDYRRCRYAR
ncbi:MAG: hypothetical protein AAF500_17960 [Myxococcota bacterium]